MSWQYTPYALPAFAAAAISITLAIWGWRRRTAPGAVWFTTLMAALGWWSGTYALEVLGTSLPAMMFATRLEYLGIGTAPVAWLLLTLAYTGRQRWLSPRYIVPLFIIPAITLVMVWTNELHGWMYPDVTLNADGPFVLAIYDHGPWFWVVIGYAYLLLGAGALLLILSIIVSAPFYRRQAATLLIGSLPCWAVNVIYVLGLSPSSLDLTPLAFTVAGLAAAWGLYRWGLLDIVPVARAAVMESLDDGIVVLDRQDRVVDINPIALRIAGQPASALIGRPAAEAFAAHADVIGRYDQLRQVHTEIAVTEEGGQQHFSLRILPLTDQQGNLAGKLIVFRDITEYRRVEQELLDRRRTLHLVIASMPNVLFIVRDKGNLSALFIPPGFPYIWRTSDLFGDLSLTDVLPDAMVGVFETMLTNVRESGEVQMVEATFVLDEELLWFEIKASPITASNDVLVVMDNITERKRVESEREQLIEDLDAFAHTVAHDLKNPLSSVLGYAEILELTLGDAAPKEVAEYLPPILRNTHKMQDIIDALLMLASVRKLERIELRPIDMADIVADTRHRVANLIQEYDAEIIAPERWPAALGHAQWVEEIIGNYVSNAIKYGGRPPRVELGGELQVDGKVRFWVRDNGPGIAPEDQAKLFTQLTRLGRTDVEGHGLGLSIVRRIAEKLGGEVGVESEMDKGSAFFFTLPAAEEKVTPA